MSVAPSSSGLEDALRQRHFAELRDQLQGREPAHVVEAIEGFTPEDQAVLFRLLPRDLAGRTFEYLAPEAQERLIKAMAREDVAAILNDMSPDDRTALLEELPAAVTRQLLALLSAQERAIALRLLGYPEKSIGRLMTPDFVAVRADWTVQQVLDHVRNHGRDSETLNVIYIVDDAGRLIDDVRIRLILLARPESRIGDLSDKVFASLHASDDQETAVHVFREYDRVALPVTDSEGVLLGIVTVDDVLDVAQEEATEDIHKIGAVEALDDPYLHAPLAQMVKKRAPWLVVLFIGEMLTATAMGYFEDAIARAVLLVLFVPLIISSGGNSGSQAATLVIRAMALGEVALHDWWRVMRREILSGLSLGAILGTIGFARIAVWESVFHLYGDHWLRVGLTVGVTLVFVVLWGTLVGSMLPFVLRRFGADPATSSAPFVATLVDVSGVLIYFSLASVLLTGTLL